MVVTIRVSEGYHEWLNAHKKSDETMEETRRRMTRGPHPKDVAGLPTEENPRTAGKWLTVFADAAAPYQRRP